MSSVQYVLYSRWMKEDIYENGYANLKQLIEVRGMACSSMSEPHKYF